MLMGKLPSWVFAGQDCRPALRVVDEVGTASYLPQAVFPGVLELIRSLPNPSEARG